MKVRCMPALRFSARRSKLAKSETAVGDAVLDSPTNASLGYFASSPQSPLNLFTSFHHDSRRNSRTNSRSSRSTVSSSSQVWQEESTRAHREHDIDQDPAESAPFTDVPEPMSICILVVGTLGDVQPFVAIGEILRSHGHRVRIGTHENYRNLVLEHGLEFSPLAADPAELSEFMVKHGGLLKPWKMGQMMMDVPHQTKLQQDIIESCWPAACSGDFRAEAIIANPVAWGHVHVAEALGNVPLHIMFPQPWVPTAEFPHPATGWAVGGSGTMRQINRWSFSAMDQLTWMPMSAGINRWRRETLGLPPVSSAEGGKGVLRKAPFSFLGSSALVSRPGDWPAHAEVVGGISMPEAEYTPSPELAAFLAAGEAPVLVTFGSMRIQHPERLARRLVAAARKSGSRVIVQSGWSDLQQGADADPNVFHLGKAPHSWLIPRCSAVVHHGGAGTTYAAAKAGKPMLICPFFGDQPFWAHMVGKTGAAVPSVAIGALTEEKLAAALEELRSAELQAKAKELMGKVLSEGDGALNAVTSFYRHLA